MRYRLILCAVLILQLFQINSSCVSTSFNQTKTEVCTSSGCITQLVSQCVYPRSVAKNATSVKVLTKIKQLKRGAFKDLPYLKIIDGTSTNLGTLVAECFMNLPSLQLVNLSKNRIFEIPYGVFTTSSIETVGLSNNRISTIEQEAFGNMPKLTYLNLSGNNIISIDKKWFINSFGLVELSFRKNLIQTINANTFEWMPKLQILYLDLNLIHTIKPDAFRGTKSLVSLYINGNNLTYIPIEAFEESTKLNVVHMGMNKITSLPIKFFERIRPTSMYIHPNPWICDCMEEILDFARKKSLTVMNPLDDVEMIWNDDLPVCIIPQKDHFSCSDNVTEDIVSDILAVYYSKVNYKNLLLS